MSATLKNRLPKIMATLPATVNAALAAGAKGIEQAAKERVAVDQGTLRDAIHTETEKDGVYVVAGNEQVFYGHLLEMGTVNQAPRPFLIPSVEEQQDTVTALVAASLRRL